MNNTNHDLLRTFVKLLYDDISYYIVDYLIKKEKALDTELVNILNHPHNFISISLNVLEKNGIVYRYV